MTATDVVLLVAAVVACIAAIGAVVAAALLGAQVRRLDALVTRVQDELVPLAAGARAVVEQAAGELDRVDAVLAGTESVTAAVDSASRLARRAFANPVVKVMAYRAGASTAIRRLRRPGGSPPRAAGGTNGNGARGDGANGNGARGDGARGNGARGR
ncbi:MAG TPA: hypothetical protein VKV36_11840 [Acidimicrobiales bacterium]|nr:hypothetical protein [Acidimicrobiales bacterium]